MKFGKELVSQMVPEWQEAYMNYNTLKTILKELSWFKENNQSTTAAMATTPKGSLRRRLTLYRAFSGLTGKQRGSQMKNEDEVILVCADDDEDTTHHTDHHLAGVKVLLQGLDNVAEEGDTVVLTIKDQPILADHGDVNQCLRMSKLVNKKCEMTLIKLQKRKLVVYMIMISPQIYDEEGITLDESGGFSGEELQRRRLTGVVSTNNNFEETPKKKKKDKLDINALEAEAISLGLGVGDLGSSRNDVKRQAIKVEQEMRNNAYQSAYAKAYGEAGKAYEAILSRIEDEEFRYTIAVSWREAILYSVKKFLHVCVV